MTHTFLLIYLRISFFHYHFRYEGAVKSQEGNTNLENFEKPNWCKQHHLVVNMGIATWIYCALVD